MTRKAFRIPLQKKWIFFYILLLPIVAFENTFKSFVFKTIFDLFGASNPAPILKIVVFTITGYVVIAVSKVLYGFIVNRFVCITMTNIKQRIFKSVIHNDDLLQEKNTASYVSLLLNDLKVVQTNYYEAILKMVLYSFVFIVSLIAIFYLNVTMAILLVVVFIIPTLVPQLIKKQIGKQTEDWTTKNEIYTSKVRDALSGIDTIRGYGLEEKIIEENHKYNASVEFSFAKLNNWRILTDNVVGFLGICGFFLVNLYGILIALKGNVTLGTVIAIVQLSNTVIGPALQIFEEYSKVMTTKKIRERIQDYEGTILCDDRDFHDMNTLAFYNNVSMINQKTFLFDDSLRSNIALGDDYSDKEILFACSRAGLGTVVEEKGLHYNVGEDGKHLSGGQRQRIEIARAFLRNRQLLLMDEATSSLDKETARDIEQLILHDRDLTVVSVAHHVERETLHLYDRVIVLVDGFIVEEGSYEELNRKSQSYAHVLA
ncbi:ABC transporter ATP-binding protein [Bacillus cereus]